MQETVGAYCAGKRVDGVVFDVDGTLTDSIEVYYQVFREATARFGIHVTREEVLEPMASGTLIWDQAIPQDVQDRDEKIKQITSLIAEIFPKAFESVRPFPAVRDVLKALEQRAVKMGVLTSSWASVIRPLQSHSLDHYFDVLLSRDDGFPLKPAPEGILECLRRMGVEPGHAVTIGDAVLDIRAGKAAGTLTIGVLSGIASRVQLEAENPTALVEGIAEILPLLNME